MVIVSIFGGIGVAAWITWAIQFLGEQGAPWTQTWEITSAGRDHEVIRWGTRYFSWVYFDWSRSGPLLVFCRGSTRDTIDVVDTLGELPKTRDPVPREQQRDRVLRAIAYHYPGPHPDRRSYSASAV